MNETPRFKHEHPSCTFLGRFLGDKYDLYYCHEGQPEVLVRFGNQPHAVLGGMVLAKAMLRSNDVHMPLAQALARACQRGLVSESEVGKEAFENAMRAADAQ